MRIKAQIDAARPDLSVLLSASAGSGKTHVLVRRIIHLLAAGVPPGSIVAATFSEKAAAQMRDRLYDTLARAAGDGSGVTGLLELGPGDAPYPIKKTPEEILSVLSSAPDELRIGTIHSLCLWILRRFPLEAGLPPDFSVMDEWEIPLRRERAVDECLDAPAADALDDEFTTLTRLGYTTMGVRSLVMLAFSKRPHLMKLAVDAGGPEELVRELEDALESGTKLDAAARFIAGGELQRQAGELSALTARYAKAKPGYSAALLALSRAENVDGFKYAFGKIKGFLYTKKGELKKNTPLTNDAAKAAAGAADPSLRGKALDAAAKAIKNEHDGLFESLRETTGKLASLVDYSDGVRALTALLRLFFRAEAIYTSSNHSAGLADFDDLETCAYRLITKPDSTGLISSLEARASHYLVDEFQDTGELQWGIIESLAREAFSGMGAQGVDSPTIFAVGDKKQSIYRFRMANHRLMDRLRHKMQETIQPERCGFPNMEHNFRSAPEILKVVDEVFGTLLPGEYAPALPYRSGARGSVTLALTHKDLEPGALADAVESALGQPVFDEASGGSRPAGFGDMAVLLRTRKRLGAYEQALRERGVPFKVVGGAGFFRQEEVRSVIGILNFIDDPADTLSLAAALKSPLFGLSDGELEPLYGRDDPVEKLKEVSAVAYALLSEWRELAGVSTPGGMVERIVEGSSARFVFGVHGGPSALFNIEKLCAMARDFDRRGWAGLAEFTGWVREYRDSSDMPGADVELPQYRQFVSVMTAHAAKGLEFPVVFIAGADVSPNRTTDRFLAGIGRPREMAVYTDALAGQNPIFGPLSDMDKEEDRDEAKRLLYVAMTRAMDHLYISSGVNYGKEGPSRPAGDSWVGLIMEAAPPSLMPEGGDVIDKPATCSYPARPVALPHVTVTGHGAPARSGLSLPPSDMLSKLTPARGPSFISPSSLAHSHLEEPVTVRPYPAALRGSAIHRAIETLGMTGVYDARRACASQRDFGSLKPGAAAGLVADVEAAVSRLRSNNNIGPLISPGPGRYFELPLLIDMGGDVVYGSADLVVIEGDTATVYDFKTGMEGVSHDAVKLAYAPQLEAYRLAVRAAFGVAEARCCIVMADTAEPLWL